MKTLVDLRGRPVDLQGKPIGAESETLGAITATTLMQQPDGPAVKLYAMAQDLFTHGKADLDIEDIRLLKAQIEKARTLLVIAKAQIILKIDEALDRAKEKSPDKNGDQAG